MPVIDMPEDPHIRALTDVLHLGPEPTIQHRRSSEDSRAIFITIVDFEEIPSIVAAGFTPADALISACEKLIDGKACMECGRMAAFDPTFDRSMVHNEDNICWTRWIEDKESYVPHCWGDV